MAFPSTISQKLLQNGYSETPLDNLIVSANDQGLPKMRRKFTGKSRTVKGALWLEDNTDYNTFMTWYYAEAGEGSAYFTFDDQHGGTMEVRMTKLEVTARGGAGYLATVELEEKPHA